MIQTVNHKHIQAYKMELQIPYRVLTKQKRRESTENFLGVEKIKIVEVCPIIFICSRGYR